MRPLLLALASALTLFGGTARASTLTPQQTLTRALNHQMHGLGAYSGAYVLDLTTGQPLYARAATVPRLPASVQKLYTTSVALLQFGPQATFSTQLLGTGVRSRGGTWYGNLYLRGGGDPTFGSAAFDRATYGTGATIEQLVGALQHHAHLHALRGRLIGDASYFDALPSTIESGFRFDPFMEGSLSALAFNRGVLAGGTPVARPPLFAAARLASALRRAHVHLGRHARLGAGRTPASARVLASVSSPTIAQLIALTNAPSDNFFAETLAKDLGARFGAGGTTAAGVAVIRAQLAAHFGLDPSFDDGSGLSRDDATSPQQVVTLVADMAENPDFTASLAVGGETGTLQDEMRRTPAQGACRGKTGTLHDVASLAGYCRAADGHTLAFAILANALGNPALGHRIEAGMAVALARYTG